MVEVDDLRIMKAELRKGMIKNIRAVEINYMKNIEQEDGTIKPTQVWSNWSIEIDRGDGFKPIEVIRKFQEYEELKNGQ